MNQQAITDMQAAQPPANPRVTILKSAYENSLVISSLFHSL